MRTRSKIAAGCLLFALLFGGARAHAQQGNPVGSHDHSGSKLGGTALRPVTLAPSGATTIGTTLTLPESSTSYFRGYISSGVAVLQSTNVAANVGLASMTLTSVQASTANYSSWHLVGTCVMSAGANLTLRVNGDSGSSFRYAQNYITDNSAGTGGDTSSSATGCRMTQNTTVSAGDEITFDLAVFKLRQSANRLRLFGNVMQNASAVTRLQGGTWICTWLGSAPPTSIQLLGESGSVQCDMQLVGMGR